MGYDSTERLRGDTKVHISEGVLSGPVLLGGALLTAGGTYVGLSKLKDKDIPKVGILSSAFFVASLIHVPLGPTSVHLILNGLNGLFLGWAVFPSILVALFLQGILFQFGGITTLGVNTFNMAFPALLTSILFRRLALSEKVVLSVLGGFLVGFFSVALSGVFVALSLALTGEAFLSVAKLILIAHFPVMLIEGVITSMILAFIRKINPKILLSSILVFLLLFLWTEPSLAHRIKTFAYVGEGGKVITRTYFTSGEGVKNADVLVYDNASGNLVLKGKTDDKGNFVFTPPSGVSELKIVVEAGMGHKSQAVLTLGEKEPSEEKVSPLEVKTQDVNDLSKLLDEKLKPIQESLIEIEEKLTEPSLSDIFGGIGYIFGIFGVWAMVVARRKG